MKKLLLPGCILTLCLLSLKSRQESLSYNYKRSIRVPEPSDIAFDSTAEHLYIVSDKGILFECDAKGTVLRKSGFRGVDFEGVEVVGDKVYVADEALRQVHRFDRKTLRRESTWYIPYSGGRNKSYESLAYNPVKKCFLMITEKDPVIIRELTTDFIPLKEYQFKAARDISSARWHNGYLYLLSDEDRSVYKCDPDDYTVIRSWQTNILNPEGIAFDREGGMVIVSDDLQRLHFYNPLP